MVDFKDDKYKLSFKLSYSNLEGRSECDKKINFPLTTSLFILNGSLSSSLLFWITVTLALVSGVLVFLWIRLSRQNKQLRERLSSNRQIDYEKMLRLTFESNENDRRRIAKEILDDVGARIQALRSTMHTLEPQSWQEQKTELYQLLDNLTERVRSISWELMPATLERFGWVSAIEELCKRATTDSGISVCFQQKGITLPLDIHQQILLYRTIQEGVDNAVKHARAQRIEVGLDWSNGSLLVTVKDDGIGFEHNPNQRFHPNPGLGLNIMESRARLLHAELNIKKIVPSGTILSLNLPVYVH